MTEKVELNEDFGEFVNDTGIRISHPGKERLALRDIYVFPDLRVLTPPRLTGAGSPGGLTGSVLISSSSLPDAAKAGGGILICGPVDSGKTSLLKILASQFLDSGFYPMYADEKSLGIPPGEGIEEFFLRKYGEQYTEENFGHIKEGPEEKRILLLDNADRIRGRSEELGAFLGRLTGYFGTVFLTAESPPEFAELPAGFSVYGAPEGFAVYELMELGLTLRQELISKWTALGATVTGDEKKTASRKARLGGAVSAVLSRNIVPSYPVFILTILQMADSDDPVAPSASSYGHYYEYLISKSLRGASGREEFSFNIALLSRLAYRMFCRRSRWISRGDIDTLIENVSADFESAPASPGAAISALIKSDTLAERESGYEFRYGYVYHYFSALYFSRHLNSDRVRDEVRRLCNNLEDEEYANIVLFLTHISNDPFVMEQISRNVEYAASSEEPYHAEEEESYLDELIREIEKLIDKDRKLRETWADFLPSREAPAKEPIGFRVLGTDIRTRRRSESRRPGLSRKPLYINALLRISSEALKGQPAEGSYDIPRGFDENIYDLSSSSLRRRKREADRARETAAGRKGEIFESGRENGEQLFFLLEIYGLYMRIYINSMRQLSLLTEAGPPEYTNTIPDMMMRICAGLFRKDHAPGIDTIGRFLLENEKRKFARELIRETAALRLYIFGDDTEYSRELRKLLDLPKEGEHYIS